VYIALAATHGDLPFDTNIHGTIDHSASESASASNSQSSEGGSLAGDESMDEGQNKDNDGVYSGVRSATNTSFAGTGNTGTPDAPEDSGDCFFDVRTLHSYHLY
jgi:hypothetical protein